MMKVSDIQIQRNAQQIHSGSNHSRKIENHLKPGVKNTQKASFQDVLHESIGSINSLRFSSHAAKRISERNIELTPTHLVRLEKGLDRVKEKGSQSSLLLMDEMAYVVSVKNQTVVTALTKQATQNNVFTNIDSVAIV